ncbi:MAG: hypothetical protein LC753_11100 [Acidobacteria bacterium]|nr:hypothetical protein [Acidobacteriota bacterium]MCA1650791.1 hypothetical protein [Acidobacteriota bacterium]
MLIERKKLNGISSSSQTNAWLAILTFEHSSTGPQRLGRRITLWLSPEEERDLLEASAAFATSTGKASISAIVREALSALVHETAEDRRQRQEPIVRDRRSSAAGRRSYDKIIMQLDPKTAQLARTHLHRLEQKNTPDPGGEREL